MVISSQETAEQFNIIIITEIYVMPKSNPYSTGVIKICQSHMIPSYCCHQKLRSLLDCTPTRLRASPIIDMRITYLRVYALYPLVIRALRAYLDLPLVCNFKSMKSPMELNSLLSKLFCYITRFVISPEQTRHWTTYK